MKTALFDYDLPKQFIAQHPAEKRDSSRLLVLHRTSGEVEHRIFADLPEYLGPGDVLVVNDTRVVRARLFGRRSTGGIVEVLLVRPADSPSARETSEPLDHAAGMHRVDARDVRSTQICVSQRLDVEATPPSLHLHASGEGAASTPAASERKGTPETLRPQPVPMFSRSTPLHLIWEALIQCRGRLQDGETIEFADDLAMTLLGRNRAGTSLVELHCVGDLGSVIERIGRAPLPPYIKRPKGDDPAAADDAERYQTVYARAPGAVAAPTAGLHFTPELLARVAAAGCRLAPITLHVGPGTFKPVTAEDVEEHRVDPESYAVPAETADAVNAARRVVAVGTTTCRVLETLAGQGRGGETGIANGQRQAGEVTLRRSRGTEDEISRFARNDSSASLLSFRGAKRRGISPCREGLPGEEVAGCSAGERADDAGDRSAPAMRTRRRIAPGKGWADLFIYPPYDFKIVDALVTNFHLPRSSLLILVSAFATRELILDAYEEAKRRGYRFYSYGDAMLIL